MPERECQSCRELQGRVADLEALVRELQAKLGINATNSSLPPSANPPQAPKPVVKIPTGRNPGGQPGHPGHLRVRVPADQLTEIIRFVPHVCSHCQAALPADPAADDPEPVWHQRAELPPQMVQVTEYQAHARTCLDCGTVTWAKIPDALRAHGYGPRLTALVSYLSGSPHVSKRGIEEIIDTVVSLPISLGTLAPLEQEMSAALAPAHAAAQQAVQDAPVKTSMRPAGKRPAGLVGCGRRPRPGWPAL